MCYSLPKLLLLLLLLLLLVVAVVDGFVVTQTQNNDKPLQSLLRQHSKQSVPSLLFLSSRYGPPLDGQGDLRDLEDNSNSDVETRSHQQKKEFRALLDQVLNASAAEHVPSLLTKHTELLLRMPGVVATETIKELLEETPESDVERVVEAVDMVVSFAEDFVTQSKTMDDNNKELLGRILRTMTDTNNNNHNNSVQQVDESSDRDREEQLDQLIASEKDNFTRGFLRYLDGECERIASVSKLSKDSARLQETLLVIKTRILEELGQELGEGALVLGQLVAYDDRNERLAVLEAGLQVRGIAFAQELMGLTEEALVGFQAVPNGDVDPTLVNRVEEIDERVRSFVKDNGAFQ